MRFNLDFVKHISKKHITNAPALAHNLTSPATTARSTLPEWLRPNPTSRAYGQSPNITRSFPVNISNPNLTSPAVTAKAT